MKHQTYILFLIFILILSSCGTGSTTSPAPIPETVEETTENESEENVSEKLISVIYDDDGSRDGMAALLYLLSVPEVEVKAVNISYGEAHPEQYIQLIGRALDYAGVEGIPLGAGQDKPLEGGTPFPDWLRELGEKFWDFQLPESDTTYPYEFAPELIVRLVNQSTEPLTLFLSGTFTNLAQALEIDATIKDKIAAVYFMGGAVYGPGNITNLLPDANNKVAEWNIIADPQAAKDVFSAGLNMYMIPLDATNQVIHTKEETLPWREGDVKANFAADLYDIMFDGYGLKSVEIFDLTAAVIMVNTEYCDFEYLSLDVITDEGDFQGQTVVLEHGDANIHVCLNPNVNAVKEHLDEVFSKSKSADKDKSIFPIAGKWEGKAENKGNEIKVQITIEKGCQVGAVCGRFDIADGSCTGTFTFKDMEGDLYRFEAGEKSSGCGEGVDFLEVIDSDSVRYISRGDYGETEGVLQRTK